MKIYPLFSSQATDGNSPSVPVGENLGSIKTQDGVSVYVYGTFGTATIAIEVSHNGSDWFTIQSGINSATKLDLKGAYKLVRAVQSGSSTSSPSINVDCAIVAAW